MNTILNWLNAAWEFITGFFRALFEGLTTFLLKAVSLLLDGLATAVSLIPYPSFIDSAGGVLGSIPPGVVWGLSIFEVQYGLSVVTAAYLFRFLLRFLPGIF